mgnify:FL=1
MKESAISREIQDFLKMVGFAVYSCEQGYRKERGGTRQTPGIPDLYIMGHGRSLWIEVKTPKGKMRDSQVAFAHQALLNDVPCVMWRDVREAFDWCVSIGIVEEGA